MQFGLLKRRKIKGSSKDKIKRVLYITEKMRGVVGVTDKSCQVNATSEVGCQVNMSKEEDDMEKLEEAFLSEDMDEEESLPSEMEMDEEDEALLSEMDTDEELFDCGDLDNIFNFTNEAKTWSILSATDKFLEIEKKKAKTSK